MLVFTIVLLTINLTSLRSSSPAHRFSPTRTKADAHVALRHYPISAPESLRKKAGIVGIRVGISTHQQQEAASGLSPQREVQTNVSPSLRVSGMYRCCECSSSSRLAIYNAY